MVVIEIHSAQGVTKLYRTLDRHSVDTAKRMAICIVVFYGRAKDIY